MNETKRQFELAAHYRPELEKKVAALQKRIAKKGLSGFTCEVVKEYTIKRYAGALPKLVEIPMITIELSTALCTNGPNTVIGMVDHTEAGNVLLAFGEHTIAEYRETKSVCEHCNTNRRRNKTFVVLNNETGERTQVGSTCLQEYAGIDPLSVVPFEKLIVGFGDEERYPQAPPVIYRGGFLACVASIVENDGGYLNASSDWPTKFCAEQLYWNIFHGKKDDNGVPFKNRVTDEHEETADRWIALADSLEMSNDFHANVRTVLANPILNKRHVGIAAAIAYVDEKQKADKARAEKVADKPASSHVGQPKERLSFDVTCTFRRAVESYYGTSIMMKFEDSAGNVLVWFNSGADIEVEPGDTLSIVGTVKKHDCYNGTKQTQINRVKVA